MFTDAYHIRHYTGHQFESGEITCLSLWLSPYSMQYAVTTSEFSQVFELGHVEFAENITQQVEEKLRFFLHNFSIQQRKFARVMVSVLNSDFTILPLSFAGDSEIKEFLQFSTGKNNIRHAFSHRLKDFRFCYSIEPDLLQVLENTFNGVFIRHAGAVNLNLFFNHRSFTGCNAALFINDRTMEIAIRENEKLLFYNVYEFNTYEDVLYYLLSAFEQYSLDASLVRLAFAAQQPLDGELVKTLKRYIKNLIPVVVGEPVKKHKEIANLPDHFYFTLLSQHQCEL